MHLKKSGRGPRSNSQQNSRGKSPQSFQTAFPRSPAVVVGTSTLAKTNPDLLVEANREDNRSLLLSSCATTAAHTHGLNFTLSPTLPSNQKNPPHTFTCSERTVAANLSLPTIDNSSFVSLQLSVDASAAGLTCACKNVSTRSCESFREPVHAPEDQRTPQKSPSLSFGGGGTKDSFASGGNNSSFAPSTVAAETKARKGAKTKPIRSDNGSFALTIESTNNSLVHTSLDARHVSTSAVTKKKDSRHSAPPPCIDRCWPSSGSRLLFILISAFFVLFAFGHLLSRDTGISIGIRENDNKSDKDEAAYHSLDQTDHDQLGSLTAQKKVLGRANGGTQNIDTDIENENKAKLTTGNTVSYRGGKEQLPKSSSKRRQRIFKKGVFSQQIRHPYLDFAIPHQPKYHRERAAARDPKLQGFARPHPFLFGHRDSHEASGARPQINPVCQNRNSANTKQTSSDDSRLPRVIFEELPNESKMLVGTRCANASDPLRIVVVVDNPILVDEQSNILMEKWLSYGVNSAMVTFVAVEQNGRGVGGMSGENAPTSMIHYLVAWFQRPSTFPQVSYKGEMILARGSSADYFTFVEKLASSPAKPPRHDEMMQILRKKPHFAFQLPPAVVLSVDNIRAICHFDAVLNNEGEAVATYLSNEEEDGARNPNKNKSDMPTGKCKEADERLPLGLVVFEPSNAYGVAESAKINQNAARFNFKKRNEDIFSDPDSRVTIVSSCNPPFSMPNRNLDPRHIVSDLHSYHDGESSDHGSEKVEGGNEAKGDVEEGHRFGFNMGGGDMVWRGHFLFARLWGVKPSHQQSEHNAQQSGNSCDVFRTSANYSVAFVPYFMGVHKECVMYHAPLALTAGVSGTNPHQNSQASQQSLSDATISADRYFTDSQREGIFRLTRKPLQAKCSDDEDRNPTRVISHIPFYVNPEIERYFLVAATTAKNSDTRSQHKIGVVPRDGDTTTDFEEDKRLRLMKSRRRSAQAREKQKRLNTFMILLRSLNSSAHMTRLSDAVITTNVPSWIVIEGLKEAYAFHIKSSSSSSLKPTSNSSKREAIDRSRRDAVPSDNEKGQRESTHDISSLIYSNEMSEVVIVTFSAMHEGQYLTGLSQFAVLSAKGFYDISRYSEDDAAITRDQFALYCATLPLFETKNMYLNFLRYEYTEDSFRPDALLPRSSIPPSVTIDGIENYFADAHGNSENRNSQHFSNSENQETSSAISPSPKKLTAKYLWEHYKAKEQDVFKAFIPPRPLLIDHDAEPSKWEWKYEPLSLRINGCTKKVGTSRNKNNQDKNSLTTQSSASSTAALLEVLISNLSASSTFARCNENLENKEVQEGFGASNGAHIPNKDVIHYKHRFSLSGSPSFSSLCGCYALLTPLHPIWKQPSIYNAMYMVPDARLPAIEYRNPPWRRKSKRANPPSVVNHHSLADADMEDPPYSDGGENFDKSDNSVLLMMPNKKSNNNNNGNSRRQEQNSHGLTDGLPREDTAYFESPSATYKRGVIVLTHVDPLLLSSSFFDEKGSDEESQSEKSEGWKRLAATFNHMYALHRLGAIHHNEQDFALLNPRSFLQTNTQKMRKNKAKLKGRSEVSPLTDREDRESPFMPLFDLSQIISPRVVLP